MESNAVDIFKIKDGELGIININNMISTPEECLTEILPLIKDRKYKILLEKQITYLNDNKKDVYFKIDHFMELYQYGKLKNI